MGHVLIPLFSMSAFSLGALVCSLPASFSSLRFLPMIAMWEIKGVVGHGAHKMALSSEEQEEPVNA